MKVKKFVVIGVIAVVALGLGGAATWWFMRPNPEKIFYEALALDEPGNQVMAEESVDSGDQKAYSESTVEDGKFKVEGGLECSAETTDMGRFNMNLGLRQVQQELFLNYKSTSFSGGPDKEVEKLANDYLKEKIAGKWVLIDDADTNALSYKEYGVVFSDVGAYSKKLSGKIIADKLKENKVITIVSSTPGTYQGKPVIEYTLSTRRSAYDKFIDSVQPGYKYKNDVLDNIFDNDTEEVTVVINRKDKSLAYATYRMTNPCSAIMAGLGTTAENMSETIKVKAYPKNSNKVNGITKPDKYMTTEEFNALLAEEAQQ